MLTGICTGATPATVAVTVAVRFEGSPDPEAIVTVALLVESVSTLDALSWPPEALKPTATLGSAALLASSTVAVMVAVSRSSDFIVPFERLSEIALAPELTADPELLELF